MEQTYRIRCTVRVCKPLLDAVVKSYGIKRKRKVIIKIIEVSVKELNASKSLKTCRKGLIVSKTVGFSALTGQL